MHNLACENLYKRYEGLQLPKSVDGGSVSLGELLAMWLLDRVVLD